MTQVIAELKGGLGNQLFIWAAAFSLAQRLDAPLHLPGDRISRTDASLDPRSFELDYFGLKLSASADSAHKPSQRMSWKRRPSEHVFNESSARYDSAWERIAGPVILRGYFQSRKYFATDEQRIRSDLINGASPSRESAELIRYLGSDWFGVHIRRGDYLNHPETFSLASREYYERAIGYLRKITGLSRAVIFSDDPTAEGFLNIEDTHFVGSRDMPRPGDHLLVMSQAPGFVGSNSSFSWWATFLAGDRDRVNIFPRPWFTDDKKSAHDLLEPGWLTLGGAG